jgi:hypothetical protein
MRGRPRRTWRSRPSPPSCCRRCCSRSRSKWIRLFEEPPESSSRFSTTTARAAIAATSRTATGPEGAPRSTPGSGRRGRCRNRRGGLVRSRLRGGWRCGEGRGRRHLRRPHAGHRGGRRDSGRRLAGGGGSLGHRVLPAVGRGVSSAAQVPGGRVAIRRLLRHGPPHDGVEGGREAGDLLRQRRGRLVHVGVDLVHVRTLVRRVPGEHLEQHAAQRVDVAPGVDRGPVDLLGGKRSRTSRPTGRCG